MQLNYLSKEDFYQVKLGSMLASYDRDTITMLYQPIMGYKATALYFTFWSESKRSSYVNLVKHELLINETGLSAEDILESRKKLEGLGLLKTYREKLSQGGNNFIYELYAPKSPQDFFDDVIFKGLLSKKISEKELEKLTLIFSSRHIDNTKAEEITSPFSDVYSVDEDEAMKVFEVKSARGRKTIDIVTDFKFGEFINELEKSYQIDADSFDTDDQKEISRLATLFGIDELGMSGIVAKLFDKDNLNHLDYESLYKQCKKYRQGPNLVSKDEDQTKEYFDDDQRGKLINAMNQVSPFDFLRYKQKLTNPAAADVKIINLLSSEYGFNKGVINAIIDYSLRKCDNTLSLPYVEKIASTLKRKDVTTALGAMNALTNRRKPKTVKTENEVNNTTPAKDDKIDNEQLLSDIEDL